MSAQVPVGAIVAYAADETNHILDLNWMLCDGSPLRKADFPDLFSAIGYANGGEGDNFLLPDLQGRFLRGELKTSLMHLARLALIDLLL